MPSPKSHLQATIVPVAVGRGVGQPQLRCAAGRPTRPSKFAVGAPLEVGQLPPCRRPRAARAGRWPRPRSSRRPAPGGRSCDRRSALPGRRFELRDQRRRRVVGAGRAAAGLAQDVGARQRARRPRSTRGCTTPSGLRRRQRPAAPPAPARPRTAPSRRPSRARRSGARGRARRRPRGSGSGTARRPAASVQRDHRLLFIVAQRRFSWSRPSTCAISWANTAIVAMLRRRRRRPALLEVRDAPGSRALRTVRPRTL